MSQPVKVHAVDIGKTASAADIIFDALRRAIVEGRLEEGEALRQDQIARLFNSSRIPVREALTRLEQHGLVTTQRYRGAVVSGLSIDEIREIFEFRALLESHVVALAVPRMTPATLAEARTCCVAFAEETDSSRWGALNRQFHYALYRDSGRRYHLRVIDAALDRVDRYLRAQITLTDGMERARREHEGILDACVASDAAKAAELIRAHILGASESLVAFLERRRAGPAG